MLVLIILFIIIFLTIDSPNLYRAIYYIDSFTIIIYRQSINSQQHGYYIDNQSTVNSLSPIGLIIISIVMFASCMLLLMKTNQLFQYYSSSLLQIVIFTLGMLLLLKTNQLF